MKPVPSEIFSRILAALNAKNAPEVAKILGITKQSVYEWREKMPALETLIKIAQTGNTSLDWLVNGESQPSVASRSDDSQVVQKLKSIAREQAPILFSDAEIAGANIDDQAAEIITEFFLARSMVGLNLIVDESEVMSAADLKRAKKMPFVANLLPSIEDRMKEIAMSVVQSARSDDRVQELGDIDAPFDVRAAVERYDDPVLVMRDWFAHDREPYMPHTLMPSGWARMNLDQKVREIEGLRAIMDRQRKRKDYAPKHSKAS